MEQDNNYLYDKASEELEELNILLESFKAAVREREKQEINAGLDPDTIEAIMQMKQQLASIEDKLKNVDALDARLTLLEDIAEDVHYIRNFLDNKLNVDFQAMYNNLLEQMNVEAIKIYRNLQAVVVEEQAKQNHVLFGVDGKSDKLKFRLNHVMIFSIISFISSILVMLIQILPALGIHLF